LCVKLANANASYETIDLSLEQLENIISLERGNEIVDDKRKKPNRECDNSKKSSGNRSIPHKNSLKPSGSGSCSFNHYKDEKAHFKRGKGTQDDPVQMKHLQVNEKRCYNCESPDHVAKRRHVAKADIIM